MIAAPLFPKPGIREVGLSTRKYPPRLSMKTFMYDEEGNFEHNCIKPFHLINIQLRTKVASAFYLQIPNFGMLRIVSFLPFWTRYISRLTDGITLYRNPLHGERVDGGFVSPEPVVQEPWDQTEIIARGCILYPGSGKGSLLNVGKEEFRRP